MDGPKKGLRVLGYEEDPGRELVMSLDRGAAREGGLQHDRAERHRHAQRSDRQAARADGRRRLRAAAEATPDVDRIVDAYAGVTAPDIAADRMVASRRRASTTSPSPGPVKRRGKKHYYRVQGPTFLIEFDNTRTTATTFTRCGATSTATSGATSCVST